MLTYVVQLSWCLLVHVSKEVVVTVELCGDHCFSFWCCVGVDIPVQVLYCAVAFLFTLKKNSSWQSSYVELTASAFDVVLVCYCVLWYSILCFTVLLYFSFWCGIGMLLCYDILFGILLCCYTAAFDVVLVCYCVLWYSILCFTVLLYCSFWCGIGMLLCVMIFNLIFYCAALLQLLMCCWCV